MKSVSFWNKRRISILQNGLLQKKTARQIGDILGVPAGRVKKAKERLQRGVLGTGHSTGYHRSAPKWQPSPTPIAAAVAVKERKPTKNVQNDEDAVEKYLKTHIVRKYGCNDTANPYLLKDWLEKEFKIKATASWGINQFVWSGKKITVKEFYARVDRLRAKRGLPPILKPEKTK